MLDNLIDSGRITRFHRSGGWVSVADDLIRTDRQQMPFTGIDKRAGAR